LVRLLQLIIINIVAPGDVNAPKRYNQHLNAQRFLLLPAAVGTQTSGIALMGHVWQKAATTFPKAISRHSSASNTIA
jgi:hypothetical protein